MATTGASLQPIYERLHTAPSYHPMSADTFADWSVEAGDIVTMKRDGSNYESPVNTSRMTWKKGAKVTISSEGNEKRNPVEKISRRKYGGGGTALRNNEYQHIYVEDMYQQMRSGLELSTSTASFYMQDAYNRLKSGLDLTSSTAALYVNNAYNRLKSGLDLTASSAKLYVDNAYNRLKAGLDLTASTAELYVDQAYNKLKAGLKATASSAKLYAESRTSKAEIIARINESGGSEVKISADRISLDGKSTVKQLLTGDASVSRLKVSNLLVQPNTGMGYISIAGCINKATVSGNTLKLYNMTGALVATFSKAITSWSVSGGSGKVRVTALPQNQNNDVYLQINGASNITSNNTYTFRAYYEKDDGSYADTGASKTVTVNVSANVQKSDISASRGSRSLTEPSHDSKFADISANGYYLITVTVNGVSKTYSLHVDV